MAPPPAQKVVLVTGCSKGGIGFHLYVLPTLKCISPSNQRVDQVRRVRKAGMHCIRDVTKCGDDERPFTPEYKETCTGGDERRECTVCHRAGCIGRGED